MSPALKVIHTLLSGTTIGKSHSTGVINQHEFHYLLSMADNILYQENYLRGRTIFPGPYITCLLRWMGLLGNVDRLTVVGKYNPITFLSLQNLGLPMPSSSMLEHTLSPTLIENSKGDDPLFLQEPLSIQWLGWSL